MKLELDLTATPYGVRGSDLALINNSGLKVHSAIQNGKESFMSIRFFAGGKEVIPCFDVETDCLTATHGGAKCEMCFLGKSAVAVKSRGFDIKIEPRNAEWKGMAKDNFGIYSVKNADGHYETVSCRDHYFATYYFYKGDGEFVRKSNFLNIFKKKGNCMLVKGDADFIIGLSDEQQRFTGIKFDLQAMRNKIEDDWQDFLAKMPAVPEKYKEFAQMTWYTLWSNMIPASRHFQSDTILMGKVGMPAIWSWDHCFNALAADFYSFDMGWTQFSAPYLYQFDNGALPDAFSNSHFYIGIAKPPVHGWCFGKLMDRHPDLSEEVLKKAYDYLKKQANYWVAYRDSDGDGIPDYPQGCDSGMDNGTVFIEPSNAKYYRRFVECPDLPSYLALQYETLARISEKLGLDATEFIQKKEGIIKKMIAHFGTEDGFVSKRTASHDVNVNAKSIIDLMPLVLGKSLPEEWRRKTIAKLKRDNLTQYGIASESPSSIYYRPEGYWRGPIWSPTTYLIIDGLRRAGEDELARDLTERYLDMVVNVAKGNYENYDAQSGKGLCVKGHTWTASVTMLLMNELTLAK